MKYVRWRRDSLRTLTLTLVYLGALWCNETLTSSCKATTMQQIAPFSAWIACYATSHSPRVINSANKPAKASHPTASKTSRAGSRTRRRATLTAPLSAAGLLHLLHGYGRGGGGARRRAHLRVAGADRLGPALPARPALGALAVLHLHGPPRQVSTLQWMLQRKVSLQCEAVGIRGGILGEVHRAVQIGSIVVMGNICR